MKISNVVIVKEWSGSWEKLQDKINEAIEKSYRNCKDVKMIETGNGETLTAILTFGY